MSRQPGGYIGFNRVPAASAINSAASGVWTLREAEALKRAGTWPASATDEFFNSVVLLLNLNGTNGSTQFTDSSQSAKTVTGSGNAQISTAQSKFGGASALFDGDGDYLNAGSGEDFAFGTGDFTVELWYRSTESSETNAYFLMIDSAGGLGFGLESNKLTVGRRAVAADHTYAHTPTQNTWTHYAVSRSGTTLKLFINGSEVLSATNTRDYTITGPAIIGGIRALPAFSLNGYVDDLRITKGVARYTSGFTPPASQLIL